jgi:hypothetical protein
VQALEYKPENAEFAEKTSLLASQPSETSGKSREFSLKEGAEGTGEPSA